MTITEDQEAVAFVRWFRTAYPAHAGLLLHVKNETPKPGKDRGGAFCGLIAKQKSMGTRKGTADYFLAMPIRNVAGILRPGLWIELKREGGSLKPEQVAFLEEMEGQGYAAGAAWGWAAAAHLVVDYMRHRLAGDGVLGVPALGDPVQLSELTLTGKIRRRHPK